MGVHQQRKGFNEHGIGFSRQNMATSNLILNPCAGLRIVVLQIAGREWFSCNSSCAS